MISLLPFYIAFHKELRPLSPRVQNNSHLYSWIHNDIWQAFDLDKGDKVLHDSKPCTCDMSLEFHILKLFHKYFCRLEWDLYMLNEEIDFHLQHRFHPILSKKWKKVLFYGLKILVGYYLSTRTSFDYIYCSITV